MEFEQIEALVQLVARSSVSEVTVRSGERRITVRRNPAPPARRSTALTAPATASERQELARIESATEQEAMHWITAPLVGIFHHAEPPVTLGVDVNPGQVVGVIESMKLMNEVRSELGGIVVESAIEAGMAVEYGQPLFAVRHGEQAEQEAEDGSTD